MSLREQQLVDVAASIVYARCADPDGHVSDFAMAEARRYLAMDPDANNWLFGYWDAAYLAKRGMGINAVHSTELVDADPATVSRCTNDPAYSELQIISADYPTGVMVWPSQASRKAVADARFVRLVTAVNQCVRKAGLSADTQSGLGGAEVGDGWGPNRKLAAFLVEARCRDHLHLTQKAADIDAEYQLAYVDAHLDELVATRQIAAARVEKATAILGELDLI